MRAYGDLKVGDRCPKCGAVITSLSVKVIKGKPYLYAYHGDTSCYLGPATTARVGPAIAVNRKPASRVASSEQTQPPQQQLQLDAVLAELRGLSAKVDALAQAVTSLAQSAKPQAEESGTGIEAVVTKNDPKRGKVYVPVEWVGKRVKIQLLE